MTPMRKKVKRISVYVSLLLVACFGAVAGEAHAAGSELVQMLTEQLGITSEQASGGAGALFNLAKTQLKSEDFNRVAAVVPDMNGLLKAAPKVEGLSSSLGSIGLGSAGGMSGVFDQFKALGLSPDMVGKFVPVLTKFVESKGGSTLSSLLMSAWK